MCCQFSNGVSIPIQCPLALPNKAVGLESQIGSWLASYQANIPACTASRAEGVEPPSRYETEQTMSATRLLTLKKYTASSQPRRNRGLAGRKSNSLPSLESRG